jgi:hypothetical protein
MFRSIIPASMLGLAVLAVAFDPTTCPCARPAKRIEASQATLAPMAHTQFA